MTARGGVTVVSDDDVGEIATSRHVELADRDRVSRQEFTEFYRSHLPAIYRFLRSRTPTVQDAEDLVQQVFFKAFQARAGFHGDDATRLAWLFRIARNERASWYRRPRLATVPIDGLPGPAADLTDLSPGPEDRAVEGERDVALASLIARLSEAEQEVIQLRFAAGLSSVQIAAVLGCSAGAARQRLHRALDRLREWSSDDLR